MHDFERDKVLLLEKGKSGLHRVIFGRTLLILLSFCGQFALLFLLFEYFRQYFLATVAGYFVFVALIELIIINKESNPSIKVSWCIVIALVPVVGGLLYLYVQMNPLSHIVNKRLEEMYSLGQQYVKKNPETAEALEKESRGVYNLARYLAANGNYQTYDNTLVKYFPLGERKFEVMIEQLEKAEKFIFLEYFIVSEGYMWGRILKILEEKARQGVEIRLMYDGFNTLTYLPVHYPQSLEKLGIRCKVFSPIRPIFSTAYNNRDHRKVLVIDGHTGFTGGINLSDEYINRKRRFGHWKDAAVMLKGEAVQGLTQMFLQMWNMDEPEPVFAPYLDPGLNHFTGSVKLAEGYVIPFADSPFDEEPVGKFVYMDMINQAQNYVYIMTPYLVLDYTLIESLTYAAKRGVDVKLILPHIPDKKYVFALAKTHYLELLGAGVHIYEYKPGFVHAKVSISDDEKAMVGTINLDYRSLYYHFEDAVFLYKVPENRKIKKDMLETLKKCHKVTMEDVKNEKLMTKLAGITLKIIAPLM